MRATQFIRGVAEGKDDKIAQLKKDHDTAVHWSKNEKSPQKREAARQKAEKIKRHLETQYKQGVAEGSESSIEKKIQAKQDSLSLAREQRRARGQRQQGQREIKLQAEIDKLNTELTQLKQQGVAEGNQEEKIGGRYDADEFDSMVSRLKKLAGAGPMRTVYDPDRRVYRNMPTAVQPAQQPKKAT